MSKSALAWAIGLVTGTVLSFRDPIFGLLTYLWEYYNHPPLRWWGHELPQWRWSLIVASMFFASYSVHGKTIFRREILRHRSTQWLVVFLVIATLVTAFLAIDPARSLDYVVDLAKLTLLFCLIVGVVNDYRKYQWITMALVLGALMWGWNAHFNPHFVAGRLERIGGPDSYNDNEAAAHVIPVLPFLALFFWQGNKWQRIAAVVAAPFIVNMIILCNSRGATMGIAGALVAGVLLMNWRLRLRLALVALLAAPLVLSLVDEKFITRQLTLVPYIQQGLQTEAAQYDAAANDRILSWQGGLKLIGERPLGVGGGGYDLLSPVYAPEVVEEHNGELRAVHNTYLWAASDWGVAGLVALLGFIGSGLLTLHRIRRQTTTERLKLESLALEVALIAFLGAAVFVNRMYAEILYWLIALSASLANIHDAEVGGAHGSADVTPRAARAA
jgi:putative inorganic carbon (HCO3(-)) transporter